MKVNNVASFYTTASPAFGRKLRKDEQPQCEQAIRDGLQKLDKNLTIILPTNCSPSMEDKDTGTGVPYSESSKAMLMPFLQQWGFNTWQQEPNYLRKPSDPSPYVSNTSAYNTLIIDLEELTTSKCGGILSVDTYKRIKRENPKTGEDRTDYAFTIEANKKALSEAYNGFMYKKSHLDDLGPKEKKAIIDYTYQFEKFVKENGEKQIKNALYTVLSEEHGNDYWPNWDNEVDRNLFENAKTKQEEEIKHQRMMELKEKYGSKIEAYLFGQMLAKQAMEAGGKELSARGIKQSADIPVAYSDAEVWGNKSLFSKNLKMGCMEPWADKPQLWGFPILDPEQLFNMDGSLGEAGEFLYEKYKRAFEENPGGVRIDHIVGLMDPYVYDENNQSVSGRLFSEMYKGLNGDPNKCDRILKEIVIPAAQAAGVNPSSIIAEDLGYMPNKTKEALHDLGICGICVTQWANAHEVWNAPKNNAVMIGCHDTATAKELYPDKAERRNKFVELFSSGAKNIQVFWTDLLGIKDRYNQPGTVGSKNWSLRMTPQFNDEYHSRLEEEDALNLPEVILEANHRRDNSFENNNPDLANSLRHWANVLKEKE